MTYQTETAKIAQKLEYILCIEGLGWTATRNVPTNGFVGHVFVTADIAGTLAAQLGCTIHKSLMPKSAFESTLDAMNVALSPSMMTFDIIDDGYLQDNFAPHRAGNTDTLAQALAYFDTTIHLTDGVFDAGTVAYIDGVEAVLLGTKSYGSDWAYAGSTRGYAGTQQGRTNINNAGSAGMTWPLVFADGATPVTLSDSCSFWATKLMRLYAHVPGEAASNCFLMWQGRITSAVIQRSGVDWQISGTGDIGGHVQRTRYSPLLYLQTANLNTSAATANMGQTVLTDEGDLKSGYLYQCINVELDPTKSISQNIDDDSGITLACLINAMYQYRTEPGGTDGIQSAWATINDIQAASSSTGSTPTGCVSKLSYSLLSMGSGNYTRRLLFPLGSDGSVSPPYSFAAEAVASWAGDYNEDISALTAGTPCRWILDNYVSDYRMSRFAVNHQVCRHPIDVALIFLTSMNQEFARFGVGAGRGPTTFTADVAFPWATDQWVGYALHSVAGENKGYARVITANTANTITVSPAMPFTNETVAAEYQIRNSIYDVLPITWGLGVHNQDIDIAAFEHLRDNHLSGAMLGPFGIGYEDSIDLWAMVTAQILQPYNVILMLPRDSGQITPFFLGDSLGDGVDSNYVQVGINNIVDIGDLDYQISNSIATINLKVRAMSKTPVPSTVVTYQGMTTYALGLINAGQATPDIDPTGGKMATIKVVVPGVTDGLRADKSTSLDWSSPFNTTADCGVLLALAISKLMLYTSARPLMDITLDISLLASVYEGTVLNINYPYAINPFFKTRGWVNVVARVLGISISFMSDKLCFTASIELLDALPAGLVAPAAICTSIAGGNTFTVSDNIFVYPDIASIPTVGHRKGDKDWWYFAVGDYVTLYDVTGLIVQDMGTITGFGANNAQTPQAANSSAIICSGSYGGSVAAGSYLSFSPWSDPQTTRMHGYAALADPATDLLNGTDDALVYT